MTAPDALDAYPLSPMQQGMLFHTLSAPGSDVYVQQFSCALHGPLKADLFREAWALAQARHAPLRTAFAWTGLPEPLQVVAPHAALPFRRATGDVDTLRAEERARGFDLARAPLMRLVLVEGADPAHHHLIWTWHHAILDAWSGPLLLEEVLASYDALTRGIRPALPPVRPFKAFIAWQKAQDTGPAAEFWRAHLEGFAAATPLDLGPAQAAARDYGLAFQPLSDDTLARLRAAARAAGVTLNTFVQGGWALLLSRLSGSDDVLFGTAVAGRPPEIAGIERMVGLFINTLPLRARIGETTLHPWLRGLQADAIAARQAEHMPLAEIQALSDMPAGAPLFDSLLVFEDFAFQNNALCGGGVTLGASDFVERANVPLTLLFAVRDVSVIGIGHDTARFDRVMALRILAHLEQTLLSMADLGDAPLAAVDPIPADDHARLDSWSRAPAPLPKRCRLPDLPVPQLFEAQAARTPDATAAIFLAPEGDQSLSYAALNTRANQLAARLRDLGVQPQDRVAICAEAGLGRLVSVLAVLKAGAAYVPLDPALPDALIGDLVADCSAALVLTQAALADRLAPLGVPLWRVAEDGADSADMAAGNPAPGLMPQDMAYLIYTSGSTGRRKGVVIEHRALRHLVEAQLEAFRIDATSRVLQFASFSFDASVSEIFTALLSGACLFMAPRQVLLPSREFLALLARWRIDTVTLPPSVLARLPATDLPDLRTLVTAGEPCPPDLVRQWREGRLFLNAYGPTEATVCATCGEMPGDGRKPAIGRPIGAVRVLILDARMRPCPIGAPGEIWIGGPQLARGYWQRPDLTAQAFVTRDGERLYRSGDLARVLPTGEIDYLGRADQQVKIRGFRVEPGEVEALLRARPGVGEVAVLPIDDRLVAFVAPESPAHPLEWWPSISEFLVYDDIAYHAMTSDERRNGSYRAAIEAAVPGKVVLEVGTGPEALLARFCIEAGARKVYAVELLEDTFLKARAKVRALGLEDRIAVIHADATQVALPERAEVCVSEIVGAIGNSEGAATILNAVRRLLTPDARWIPERSRTLIAPVELPTALRDRRGFGDLQASYVEKIFADFGHPFDLRLCARGLGYGALLAAPAPFEDFDYRQPVDPAFARDARFEITRTGRVDGFLVWLTLDCGAGPVLDILKHEHCWLPVFFPLGATSIDVTPGDRIDAHCAATLCDDGLHTDYRVTARIGAVDFAHVSPHHATSFRQEPFSAAFHAPDGTPRRIAPATLDPEALLQAARQHLPDYMVPAEIVRIDHLPLSSAGKVDRAALLDLRKPQSTPVGDAAPQGAGEDLIASIWAGVLGRAITDIRRNFFEQGGTSLLLMELQTRIGAATGQRIEITDLFKYPTIAEQARRFVAHEATRPDPAPTDRAAARSAARGGQAARRKKATAR
ncbi:MAG: amino acid adenylation domain-containing protein [Rhodobacteraceae bacterium]|nr:MAG: amino acid adenylation domain-containing protein [Paracoccaceae bacterium]